MTLPRPVLIAVLGLALITAALVATRTASNTATTEPPPAPAPAAKQAKPAKDKDAPASKPEANRSDAGAAKSKPDASAATPAKPAAPARPAAKPDSEAARLRPIVKALAKGDAVVLFFSRPGAADDTGTRGAVRSAGRMDRVSVFNAGLEDLVAFRSVLQGAGVSQVPAVVVIRAGRKAKLLEGYVDERTLRQNVADALR